MAEESMRLAIGAPAPEVKAGFLSLAASWGTLADQVERQAGRSSEPDRNERLLSSQHH
ncbi:MAG TPA: hypothetical protein VGF97_10315 [Rhizomicrobium sp.]|jgi:hypothetical protein